MGKRSTLFLVLVLISRALICREAIAESVTASLQSFENYSRVTIPVLNGSNFKTQSVGTDGSVKIDISHIQTAALESFNAVTDARVHSMQWQANGLDNAVLKLSLANPSMEYFAYMQPSPPAIIVDIWSKKTADMAEKSPAKKTERKLASVSTHKALVKKNSEPKMVEPLSIESGIFQKFPQPMPVFTYAGKKFRIPQEENLEKIISFKKINKELPGGENFLFMQRLFNEKKYGLAIRAEELTARDFPQSIYLQDMKLLKAMSYKKLGEQTKQSALMDKAEEIYTYLMNATASDGKNNPFTIPLKAYFATKAFREKRWIEAVEQFESLGKMINEKDEDFIGLQMALAESYIAVEQYRKAEKIYRYINEHFKGKELAKEAEYRRGTMLAMEKNYERAAEIIEAALNEYPEYEKIRAETRFNLAEAYFGLGNFKRARTHFLTFTKQHPSQTMTGLAYIRLGEIAEVQEKNISRAKEFYLLAKDGFPYSYGAKIASVRLARLNLFEEKDSTYPIRQIQEILQDNTFPSEARKMAKAVLIEYFMKDHSFKEASAMALSAMSEVSGVEYKQFKNLYVKSLADRFHALVQEKELAKALALYEEQKKWLALGGAEVLKDLGDAYRGLGLYETSNKYLQQYALEKRKESDVRSLASINKEDKSIRLEKAKNSYDEGKYAEALNFVSDQPPSAEVLRIQAVSNFKLGRWKDSYALAEKALQSNLILKDKVSAAHYDAVVMELTDILLDRDAKDKNYAQMEKTLKQCMDILSKKNERYEFLYADALWYQRKHEQALKHYKESIAAYPKSDKVARAKYNKGMSELALGKRQEAVKTLTDLRDSGQSLWSQSAKQELELLEWETKYSSVLRSLPPTGMGITN